MSVNMSDASFSSVKALPPPFQLVPIAAWQQQLWVLYSLYGVLIFLSLAGLALRWSRGHRVLLTCRDGVIIPGTTSLLLLVVLAFLCCGEVFLWKMQQLFSKHAGTDDLIPVWSASWSLLVIVAFVEVWGLWTAANFRPGAWRQRGQNKLLIPALPFNLIFGALLVALVALTTIASIRCTLACTQLAVFLKDRSNFDVEAWNQANMTCMFWIRFRNITLSSALIFLVVGELTAYFLLRRRLRAEVDLLEREYAGWKARLELVACDAGWASFSKTASSRRSSLRSDAAETDSYSTVSSAPPYSASLATPRAQHSPPAQMGPIIITGPSGKEQVLHKCDILQKHRPQSCPRRRAATKKHVLQTLTLHAGSLTIGILCFLAVCVAQTIFIGGLDLSGWGTILTLGVLWTVPVSAFPIVATVLIRSSWDKGSFLGTTTVPVLSRQLTEIAGDEDEDDDDEFFIVPTFHPSPLPALPKAHTRSTSDTVHIHLPSSDSLQSHSTSGSSTHSSHAARYQTSSGGHRLPPFTIGMYPAPARHSSFSAEEESIA